MKLNTIVEELSKEDWKRIRQFAQNKFIENGASTRNSDWFVARCYVEAFVDLVYSKKLIEDDQSNKDK